MTAGSTCTAPTNPRGPRSRNCRSSPTCPAMPASGDAEARERNDAALAGELSQVFAQGTRVGWVGSLTAVGVSAMENQAIPDFHDDPHVRQAGLVVGRQHPGMGMADHLGVVARLSGTPARLGRPTPVLGAETDEILGRGRIFRRRNCRPQVRQRGGADRRLATLPQSTAPARIRLARHSIIGSELSLCPGTGHRKRGFSAITKRRSRKCHCEAIRGNYWRK